MKILELKKIKKSEFAINWIAKIIEGKLDCFEKKIDIFRRNVLEKNVEKNFGENFF